MASTNKTTNYELSQFIGTDKPAWLSDYNQDMSKIDTAIKNASDTATSASGSATSANSAIGTLSSLTTTEKGTVVGAINEVDSNADTAQGTANDAYTLATTNATKISSLEHALNITTINTCTITKSNNISNVSGTIKCATNSTQSIFKIYGDIVLFAGQNTSGASVTFSNTGIGVRDTAYDIDGVALFFASNGGVYVHKATVKTNGDIEIPDISFPNTGSGRLYLAPILYFDKNFGD